MEYPNDDEPDIFREAKHLAQSHRLKDPQTTIIKFFPLAQGNEIGLLEVSGAASTTNEILPFTFRAAPEFGIHYPSTVILVSPEEWEKMNAGALLLPAGWDLDNAEDL